MNKTTCDQCNKEIKDGIWELTFSLHHNPSFENDESKISVPALQDVSKEFCCTLCVSRWLEHR